MKTTMLMRPIANPRRTTLAHLEDAEELQTAPAAEQPQAQERSLPQQTANPRRTVLTELPNA
ncbi:hypothetical protein NGB36_31280 [Streptomyces sp. RB6PN25]|uniref:Uncharacterized protein n=1 Tax=Streptomyces humicola TaxID=2953240 RepID=A0ABT1Q4R4_9ACTN|nr:hypothetical protein [Streptomyces humicola]MCQ4084927.1 hypothetical protein [Streptomyces humicola]